MKIDTGFYLTQLKADKSDYIHTPFTIDSHPFELNRKLQWTAQAVAALHGFEPRPKSGTHPALPKDTANYLLPCWPLNSLVDDDAVRPRPMAVAAYIIEVRRKADSEEIEALVHVDLAGIDAATKKTVMHRVQLFAPRLNYVYVPKDKRTPRVVADAKAMLLQLWEGNQKALEYFSDMSVGLINRPGQVERFTMLFSINVMTNATWEFEELHDIDGNVNNRTDPKPHVSRVATTVVPATDGGIFMAYSQALPAAGIHPHPYPDQYANT